MSRVCLFEIRRTRITFASNVYGEDIKPNQNSISSLCVVSQVRKKITVYHLHNQRCGSFVKCNSIQAFVFLSISPFL